MADPLPSTWRTHNTLSAILLGLRIAALLPFWLAGQLLNDWLSRPVVPFLFRGV
jgi:uncharacterized membrane protein